MPTELLRYLPTFLLVAEELSFSATARRLGLTPAAVSKAVGTLERGLGLRLFHRSTHALRLTDDGERLRIGVGPHLKAVQGVLSQIQGEPDQPRGQLRVAAPYSVGKHHLVPLLSEFRARYPEVELDLRFDDHVIDLVQERIDVALGSRLDPSPGLISKKLIASRTMVVASPQFLKAHGTPQHPSELERFACLRYRVVSTGRLFPWLFREPATGTAFTLNPPAAIAASTLELVAELAADHLGLALTGTGSVGPYLRDGRLVEVLSDYAYEMPAINLYYRSGHDLPSRVRAFIDFVAEHVRD